MVFFYLSSRFNVHHSKALLHYNWDAQIRVYEADSGGGLHGLKQMMDVGGDSGELGLLQRAVWEEEGSSLWHQ